MGAPTIINDLRDRAGDFAARVKCPGCGLVLLADYEQFRGEVSMDCPDCQYHETHDLSEVSQGGE